VALRICGRLKDLGAVQVIQRGVRGLLGLSWVELELELRFRG
jgi:hypothetical protein